MTLSLYGKSTAERSAILNNNGNSVISDATAKIKGSGEFPEINGVVTFRQMPGGVLVTAEVFGLPCERSDGNCIYGFHIHSGNECSGNESDPFANVNGHYNPRGVPHPYHAGDLPPLFGNGGYAYMRVFTNRFTVSEIVGRTVIIHGGVDDFTSQPAGNAGSKIACGKILPGEIKRGLPRF